MSLFVVVRGWPARAGAPVNSGGGRGPRPLSRSPREALSLSLFRSRRTYMEESIFASSGLAYSGFSRSLSFACEKYQPQPQMAATPTTTQMTIAAMMPPFGPLDDFFFLLPPPVPPATGPGVGASGSTPGSSSPGPGAGVVPSAGVGAGAAPPPGMRTASILCRTPSEASMSASVTSASLIMTVESEMLTVRLPPLRVGIVMPSERSVEKNSPEATW
mmetsp:Transcript_2444/g.7588  ORF Transcript_2444/g.7588 Transcript_2444/m.7588 type:complete len:217 (-) Transcript_2444:854-1504(-)